MKKTPLLLVTAAAAVAAGNVAADVSLRDFRSAPVHSIPLPAQPDSIETGTRDYDRAGLLQARRAADYFHRYLQPDWTTVSADTAGTVAFRRSDNDNALLYVLRTRMRPDRFLKGKLKIESTSMAEVWVNGESVIRKESTDSTLTATEGPLSIEPEMEADVEIHLLSLPDDKSDPQFRLSFIPDDNFGDVALEQGPAIPKHFTINEVVLGRRLANIDISPDGRYAALSYTETYGEGDVRRFYSVIETATRKTVIASLSDNPVWMPAGASLLTSERNGSSYDFYRTDLPSMKRSRIASDVPVQASEALMAPDGSFFLYYKTNEGKKEEGVMKRYTDPDDRMPGNRDRAYIRKYDIATGVESPVTFGGPTTAIADISPDSRKLLYITSRETPGQWPFYSQAIVQLDLATLATDTIVKGEGALNAASYSPDGKELLILAGPNSFGAVGKNAGNHEIANDFDIQAFIMNLSDRKVRPMTRDFNPSIGVPAVWNKADNMIYFKAEDGFDLPLYRMNPKSGDITRLDVKTGFTRNFSIGNDESRWLGYTGMDYTYSGRGYLLDLKNGNSILIDDPMADQLSTVEFGKSEKWTFTSSNGDLIDGEVTYPPSFDPSRKYPLIVYYYGGTSPSDKRSDHPYTPQLFASRDYVVYVVNPSGTTGYGQEFSARHVNAWGDMTADEIIEGVKKFCQEHPFVDDKKIGCLGASYGGFMTQLLQTKTDIFAAAVSHAGISNVASYWGEGYWGYSYNSVAAAKSYPWNNPDLFTKHGSLFNADKIHTPLLLLHGTQDTNVPIGESIQIFNALKILGRDVEFITVEDQNHVITDFNKRKLWHATIMAWFAKYLQDDPRWWDSLYK